MSQSRSAGATLRETSASSAYAWPFGLKLLVWFGLFFWTPTVAFAQAPLVREQDGIIARLDITKAEAIVSWRFARRPPDLLDRVDAVINGRPAGTPTGFEPSTGPGEVPVVTLLVDVGGLERAREIEAAERAILDTRATLPHAVKANVGAYDTEFHAIDSPSAAVLRTAAAPRDITSNLSHALTSALAATDPNGATAHAIYVYTDGFNADPKGLHDAQGLATASGTTVSFVLLPSMRLVDILSIEEFARATGGRIVPRPSDVTADIATFLTSGAQVRFPLDAARRFVWEPRASVDVTLAYGDRRLALSSPIDVPVAGPAETIEHLWRRERPVTIIGGAIVLLVASVVLWWRGKRRRPTLQS